MESMQMTHRPLHPGQILKRLYLDPSNYTITAFAKQIGVSRKTVSAIVNGRQAITTEMAIRLATVFPTTTAMDWLNLQVRYNVWIISSNEEK